MAQQDAVIRLLLVEDRLEDAEQLISHLRNGGMAVRPHRPESEDDLASILGSQSIDLVLAAFDAKYIPIAHVVERVIATGKDIPVVVASTVLDEKIALSALSLGIRDIALRQKPEHVQAVVRAEFGPAHLRKVTLEEEVAENFFASIINTANWPAARAAEQVQHGPRRRFALATAH